MAARPQRARNALPRWFCLILPLFFMGAFPLNAQNAQDGGYYVDHGGGEPRFFQRFVWDGEAYTLGYEVVIERQEGEGYREALREFTTGTALTVSLPPGNYRFAITAYDLLNRPGESPAWTFFEILPAWLPELRGFTPPAFYLDEDTVWVVNLEGQNLSPGAEVWLRHTGKEEPAIVPVKYTAGSRGTDAQLVFSTQSLNPGTYEIYLRNPGGLDAVAGTFSIAFRKPLDIYVSAAYTPLVPLYGDFNRLMESVVFPLGAMPRLTIIPFKRVFGYGGLELTAAWHYFDTTVNGVPVTIQGLGGTLSAVFQKWLPNRVMAFSFRAGGGIVSLLDFRVSYPGGGSPDPLSLGTAFQAGAGASFLWLVRRPFFMEAGLDFAHWFLEANNAPGYLQPWLALGWQF